MLVRSHWDEVTRHLTPPRIAWEWSECGLSHRTQTILKGRGLIKRAPGGERWMTTMKLWCYVIAKAADDETIGAEVRGQETLDVTPDTSTTTRFLHHNTTTTPSLSREWQSTLNGDVTSVTRDTDKDQEEMREPWCKDPTWSKPTSRDFAANHPAQTELTAWVTEGGSKVEDWAVDTTGSEAELSQPNGRVYYPATSASPGGKQATLTAFTPRQWGVTVPG